MVTFTKVMLTPIAFFKVKFAKVLLTIVTFNPVTLRKVIAFTVTLLKVTLLSETLERRTPGMILAFNTADVLLANVVLTNVRLTNLLLTNVTFTREELTMVVFTIEVFSNVTFAMVMLTSDELTKAIGGMTTGLFGRPITFVLLTPTKVTFCILMLVRLPPMVVKLM